MLCESELCAEKLENAVEHILGDEKVLAEMSKGSKSIGIPDSTNRIYRILRELVKK